MLEQDVKSPEMGSGTRTLHPERLNKGLSLKLPEGFLDRQAVKKTETLS